MEATGHQVLHLLNNAAWVGTAFAILTLAIIGAALATEARRVLDTGAGILLGTFGFAAILALGVLP